MEGRPSSRVGPIVALMAAGTALGAGSAAEEATSDFDVGISTDGLWLAVAFTWGAVAWGWGSALVGGVALLTIANVAYYAAGGGAPDAARWLLLGVAAGVFYGAAGQLFRRGPEPARLAAILSLSAVLMAEGAEVFQSDGEADDGVEFGIGLLLPIVMTRGSRHRLMAAAASVAVGAVAATGLLEPLVP